VSDLSDAAVLARFPDSIVTHDNIEFYRGLLDRKLVFLKCSSCAQFLQPQTRFCPHCLTRDTVPEAVDGAGVVFMFTQLHQGVPAGFTAPHPVVTCQLDAVPDVRFTSTIINCPVDDLRIGMEVELDWIEIAGNPAPVFTPRATP
jgi:uncharacterized OB-fold protein